MKRRSFLGLIATFLLAPTLLAPTMAFANDTLDYSPGLIKKQLAEGKVVFVDYAATWCGTCKRQSRIINVLRSKNPTYNDGIVFVKVDWDEYGNEPIATSRKIPRRSTLLVLKGDQELGRLIASTSTEEIKALLDTGMKSIAR